jgi:hypothetical protein
MSLKLQFSALSLGGAIDQTTGALSVFEILEEIRVPQLPIQIPNLTLTLSLEKQVPTAMNEKLFIHVLSPDGKQALLGSGDMAIPAEQRRVRAMFRLGGFPVTSFGAHRIVVSWVNASGAKEGEALFDFDVIQVKPEQMQGGPAGPGPAGVAH